MKVIRQGTPGFRLRQAREAAGLDQAELAAEAELSRAYISGLETGSENGGREAWVRIAKSLNVSVDYLLLGEKAVTPDSITPTVIPRHRRKSEKRATRAEKTLHANLIEIWLAVDDRTRSEMMQIALAHLARGRDTLKGS